MTDENGRAKIETETLRRALTLALHAFRAALSYGQNAGLARGELTCLIALGEEAGSGRMGSLSLDEERQTREALHLPWGQRTSRLTAALSRAADDYADLQKNRDDLAADLVKAEGQRDALLRAVKAAAKSWKEEGEVSTTDARELVALADTMSEVPCES